MFFWVFRQRGYNLEQNTSENFHKKYTIFISELIIIELLGVFILVKLYTPSPIADVCRVSEVLGRSFLHACLL